MHAAELIKSVHNGLVGAGLYLFVRGKLFTTILR
jgi:hypothetical protein